MSNTPPPMRGFIESLLNPLPQPQLIQVLTALVSRYPGLENEIADLVSQDPAKRKLYVSNIDYRTSSEALHRVFSVYGRIIEASVITDKITQRSRGFGFVTFADIASAERAVMQKSLMMDGRVVEISWAMIRQQQAQQAQEQLHNNTPGPLPGGMYQASLPPPGHLPSRYPGPAPAQHYVNPHVPGSDPGQNQNHYTGRPSYSQPSGYSDYPRQSSHPSMLPNNAGANVMNNNMVNMNANMNASTQMNSPGMQASSGMHQLGAGMGLNAHHSAHNSMHMFNNMPPMSNINTNMNNMGLMGHNMNAGNGHNDDLAGSLSQLSPSQLSAMLSALQMSSSTGSAGSGPIDANNPNSIGAFASMSGDEHALLKNEFKHDNGQSGAALQ